MKDEDALYLYVKEKELNDDTPPYSKEALTYAIQYPLTYKNAYQIWKHFGTERANVFLPLAYEKGLLPCDDMDRLEEFEGEK